jgi:superfamily II DNA/RNA helicase
MKAASIKEIKEELIALPPKHLLELCLKLVKYKKENKELLTYLLFEEHDEHGYVEIIKKEIDMNFLDLPKASVYLTKKSLRKIIRSITKYSKYTVVTQSEVEMLLHFCFKLKASTIPFRNSIALSNLYSKQLKKLNVLIHSLHEDLHYDYKKQMENLV